MDFKKILNDILSLLPFNGNKTKYSTFVAVAGGVLLLLAKPDATVFSLVVDLLNSVKGDDMLTAGIVGAAVGGAHKVVKG